jgi:serine protease Do
MWYNIVTIKFGRRLNMSFNYNYENYELNNKKRKGNKLYRIISIFLAVVLVAGGAGTIYIYKDLKENYAKKLTEFSASIEEKYNTELQKLNAEIDSLNANNNSTLTLANTGDTLSLNTEGLSVSQIAEKVSPSVVGIRITIPSTQVTNGFFQWETEAQQAEGSGIIITQDGYIATNYHVVEYKDQYDKAAIDVILKNGKEYPATFIAADKQNDLAVIKINETGLPTAELGKSSELVVGELAVAIGNPLGLSFAGSVTVGVISALDRTISGENVAESMIQTDAAINPGNSGGALINSKGQIIGINTVKISSTAVEGLGFAIPIDYAKPIIESLIKYGYVKGRPAVGFTGQEISSTMSKIYNIPTGLYITEVTENSGAELAGIKAGDIILTFDDKKITTMNELEDLKKAHKVGDVIKVTYYRNGDNLTANIMLLEDKG